MSQVFSGPDPVVPAYTTQFESTNADIMLADIGRIVTKRWICFRYSLRALLLLTVMLAISFGYVANRAKQKRNALEALAAGGAEIFYAGAIENSPDVSLAYSGGDLYRRETGRDWQQTRGEDVGGNCTWLSAGTVVAVRFHPSFRKLNNDSGDRWQDVGAALHTLDELASLKALDFDDAEFIADDDLSHLEGLTNLERLFLAGTNVGDAGLAKITDLTKLRYLSLRGTKISDAGLTHLKRLSQLEMLELCDTDISDQGIEPLKCLKGLKHLFVSGTKITARGLNELKSALPGCEVTSNPPGTVG